MTEFILAQILPHYINEAEREDVIISPLGNGHINHTWLVKTSRTDFVLQKINTHVFPDPWVLINNIQQLHHYLTAQNDEYRFQSIGCLQTLAGNKAFEDEQVGFWRALDFIDNSYSIDMVDTPEQAFEAAKAIGHFSAVASNISDGALSEIIPDFHNLSERYRQLESAMVHDKSKRRQTCQPFIDDVLSQRWLVDEIEALVSRLPIRICHNDTKINNLLFDCSSHQVNAVIDLDTCMPGHLMYDFGDMVRTFCSPEAEDSIEFDKVIAREEIFEAIVNGYLSELGKALTVEEHRSLWLGALAMPLQLSVRFLTDYLNGDEYFKTSKPQHNLHRAQNQWHLFQSLMLQKTVLKAFFEKA